MNQLYGSSFNDTPEIFKRCLQKKSNTRFSQDYYKGKTLFLMSKNKLEIMRLIRKLTRVLLFTT